MWEANQIHCWQAANWASSTTSGGNFPGGGWINEHDSSAGHALLQTQLNRTAVRDMPSSRHSRFTISFLSLLGFCAKSLVASKTSSVITPWNHVLPKFLFTYFYLIRLCICLYLHIYIRNIPPKKCTVFFSIGIVKHPRLTRRPIYLNKCPYFAYILHGYA